MLDKLKAPEGAIKRKKRVGRGEGSGLGKTSGRGHKGQRSRAGGRSGRGFEGGQMPLQRRLPKRGFKSRSRKIYNVINIGLLSRHFNAGDTVDMDILLEKRVIKKRNNGIKILGNGEVDFQLIVRGNKFSAMARKKILAAGGKVEVI